MTTPPDSLSAPETIIVETRRVSCDGGGGPLGHPLVFYEMGDDDCVECQYCGRRFILAGSSSDPNRPSSSSAS